MVVIADTSPIDYLLLIGEIEILQRLYDRIVLPEAVHNELIHEGASTAVRSWALRHPEWVEVRRAAVGTTLILGLDAGEAEAISLAESESDALLVIDDSAGRIEAARRGIRTIGTLGVLRSAATENLIALPSALEKLRETNLRVSKLLSAKVLAEDIERRSRQ